MKKNVGYNPGQKVRDRIISNTEVQIGYAPGFGAFGVPIVKPRKKVQPERPDLKANFLRLKRLADKMDKGGE